MISKTWNTLNWKYNFHIRGPQWAKSAINGFFMGYMQHYDYDTYFLFQFSIRGLFAIGLYREKYTPLFWLEA